MSEPLYASILARKCDSIGLERDRMREQLRHSKEVSTKLLAALKRIWPHARTENDYTTTDHEDYHEANELVRAAIALAERS